MPRYVKPRFRIEIPTGDKAPAPEWLELRGDRRFRFVTQVEAERMVERIKRYQPHAVLRVAPIPE